MKMVSPVIARSRWPALAVILTAGVFAIQAAGAQPNYDPSYVAAAPHAAKGFELFQQGKFPESEAEYRQAIKHCPLTMDFQVGLAAACVKNQRLDEAAGIYRMVLDKEPTRVELLDDYGDVLYQLKKLEEALTIYKRSIESDPKTTVSHRKLGTVLTELGKGNEAIAEYQKAIEAEPNDGSLYYALGTIQWRAA